jgi:glycosyltransferase involved in cell wall biosynthesis
MIEVPLNSNKDGDIDTEEKRAVFQKNVEAGLKKAMIEILNTPDIITKKGDLCIERIAKEHSPENYKNQLKAIYKDNFKDSVV